MFSHVYGYDDLRVSHSTANVSDELAELGRLSAKSRLEYEESKATLTETHEDIARQKERLSIIERDRVNIMSELAAQTQAKQCLNNKLEEMRNELSSTEFELKKCNKMKTSSVDLETLARIKNKFITYKSMLKIHFDYSNGLDSTIQKGYIYNRTTKNLTYFEFNTDEKTADEITEYLWNKMKIVSDKNWDSLVI